MPILEELSQRLRRQLQRLGAGLSSGDEASIVKMLKTDVEPLFVPLKDFSLQVRQAIESYQGALDGRLGTVYRKRKEFEESMSLLNKRVSIYLDREQVEAQAVFPQYFEKHQTDGLDYLIYVGASLSEKGVFNSRRNRPELPRHRRARCSDVKMNCLRDKRTEAKRQQKKLAPSH